MTANEIKQYGNPRDALGKWDPRSANGPNRTVKFGVINQTPFAIEVAFGQILSRYVGNGYIGDTGVWRSQ
jgi:hypothetical protein